MFRQRTVVLNKGNYTTCTVNLFGATITSWRVKQVEQIFMSTASHTDNKVSIRGGIPIIFPQYAHGIYTPHHGFARLMVWEVLKEPTQLPNGNVQAVFTLEDDDYSRSMWHYSFLIKYFVTLGESDISLRLEIYNRGNVNILFHALFHPYLRVPDVKDCKIGGLLNVEFIDKVKGSEVVEVDVPILQILDRIDRVYKKTRPEHIISNVCNNKIIKIEKINCPDTVIWNPGKEQSKTLSHIEKSDYPHMICIGCGYANDKARVEPNGCLKLILTLKLLTTRAEMNTEIKARLASSEQWNLPNGI